MKTAAKVFIIISIILGAFFIYPLILGMFAYLRLDEAKKVEDIKGWGIVTLLFVSQIGGIIMLCMKDEDLQDNYVNSDKEYKSEIYVPIQVNSSESLLYEMELYDEI